MMSEPVILETLMWVAIFLSLPAIWWVFGVIGEAVGRFLFPSKTITLTVIENGEERTKTISLEDTDALVEAILSMKEKPST